MHVAFIVHLHQKSFKQLDFHSQYFVILLQCYKKSPGVEIPLVKLANRTAAKITNDHHSQGVLGFKGAKSGFLLRTAVVIKIVFISIGALI
jgi:hypothetical protein